MTLWDMIHRCFEGLYRLCQQGWHLLASMLRLSFRLWWLVGLFAVAGAAAGIYYSRPSNKMYKVNAIATLNGPSFQQVADYYESLGKTFRAFAVVDCRHDGTADFVDYKNRHPREDSVNVCMSDQIALQFITKKKADFRFLSCQAGFYFVSIVHIPLQSSGGILLPIRSIKTKAVSSPHFLKVFTAVFQSPS